MAVLSDNITVTVTSPVDKFEVRVKAVGGSTYFVSDPADDPDADGDIELTPDAGGLTASVSVSKFLVGQATGPYTAEARSFDTNGQASAWASQGFNYNPPPEPVISVG